MLTSRRVATIVTSTVDLGRSLGLVLVAEGFADVTVTELAGSDHFMPLEAPEAFAPAIRASWD